MTQRTSSPGSDQSIHSFLRHSLCEILQTFATQLYMVRPSPVNWPVLVWMACQEPPLQTQDAFRIGQRPTVHSFLARQTVSSVAMLSADGSPTTVASGRNNRRDLEWTPGNGPRLLDTLRASRSSGRRSRRCNTAGVCRKVWSWAPASRSSVRRSRRCNTAGVCPKVRSGAPAFRGRIPLHVRNIWSQGLRPLAFAFSLFLFFICGQTLGKLGCFCCEHNLLHFSSSSSQLGSAQFLALCGLENAIVHGQISNGQAKQDPVRRGSGKLMAKCNVRMNGLPAQLHCQAKRKLFGVPGFLQLNKDHVPRRLADVKSDHNKPSLLQWQWVPFQNQRVSRQVPLQRLNHPDSSDQVIVDFPKDWTLRCLQLLLTSTMRAHSKQVITHIWQIIFRLHQHCMLLQMNNASQKYLGWSGKANRQ